MRHCEDRPAAGSNRLAALTVVVLLALGLTTNASAADGDVYAQAGALPKTRVWEPGQLAPSGYHVETKPYGTMLWVGAGLFGGLWIGSVFAAAALTADEPSPEEETASRGEIQARDWTSLYVPILGPFLTLKNVDASNSAAEPRGAGLAVLLLLDGFGQMVGTVMLFGSLGREEHLVPNESARTTPRVTVSRIVGRRGGGFGIRGSF